MIHKLRKTRNTFIRLPCVIPQVRGHHWYYLLSPEGDGTAEVSIGGVVTTHTLPTGQVVEIDGGSDNTVSVSIRSDAPILVTHVGGDSNGPKQDASPAPPAATELWGVQSGEVHLGALEDLTTITILSDDGGYLDGIVLDAGDRYSVSDLGSSDPQGQGSALRIMADKPIAAVQVDDGDGTDQSAFLPTEYLAVAFGLPTDSQYVAVVCPWPDTSVTLYDGADPPEARVCTGDGVYPGKVLFGSADNGAHISAGARIESNEPVYLMYEDSARDDERNLMGMP
ncbi:MAG: hypothetical protein BECKG1743D_GA0114223_100022 [Candidatus Kentron sp. G]|nr:MAG: hypothetical protein BECKG1743F_GA0114225_100012 [Candidatus Kentron sp. G]VFM95466.1 MAG: hypothetical protein BECKG1743E_GA0114224_1000416 [Candidatus Kentron sp. G]VFM97057.1 MAG: hypothetical protein BECKG1743D_GA0114223_100022 [Candidatus Kentron sp. G]